MMLYRRLNRRAKLVMARIALIAVALVIWEYAAGGFGNAELLPPFLISSPTRVANDLVRAGPAHLLGHVWFTLKSAGLGLGLGLVSGIVVGMIFGFSRTIADLFEPFMGVFNALPRPALAPIAILWFGLGLGSKVFIAWTMVFFVIFYNTYGGIKAIEPEVLNAIKVMHPTRLELARIVVLPAVASWVFAALQLAVAVSLIGAIIGEIVGSTAGLGYELMRAQGLLRTDRVFSVFVMIALVAWVTLGLAKLIERKVVKWRPSVSLVG